MGHIYKLTFKSGKSYIGQSMRKLTTRMTRHRAAVTEGSRLPVHCAWREHGVPELQVIAESDDADELHALEIAAIAEHGTLMPDGYNLGYGGKTAPSSNPEVAAKIAARATGRKCSDETKAQIAEAMRQRWKDPEYRSTVIAKAAAAVKTESAREKFSASGKARWERQKAEGWTMPESTKEKLRSKVFTEETRAKMSAAAKARIRVPPSAETRAKFAANAKATWASMTPEERAQRLAAIDAGQIAAAQTRRAKSLQGSAG